MGKTLNKYFSARLLMMGFIVVGVIVIGVVGLILIRNREQKSQQNGFGWGQRPGGAQDMGQGPVDRPRTATKFSGVVPEAPKGQIEFYKGITMGTSFYNYYEQYEFFENPKKLKDLGVNIFGFMVEFELNAKGEIRYPVDFPTIKDIDNRIGEIAETIYGQNIRLWILVQVNYKEQFSKDWGGEPRPIPRDIYTKPGIFNEYDKAVIEVAKLAQKYQVEMFAPVNEPDGALGSNGIGSDQKIIDLTQAWTDKLLAKTRQVYKGKIAYKGDLHDGQGEKLSFKGYDILGLMPRPTPTPNYNADEFRAAVRSNIANARRWAARDGVPQVMIAEFSSVGQSVPLDQAQEEHKIMFEEARNLDGIFVNDPAPFKGNYQAKIRELIKNWYTQKL